MSHGRVFIKSGVWKNTEDEILKAAIMKYGKNQWSRVSSLMPQKTAKQCKCRWYEWLDPSIKKTGWTRIEEEKLLHLAKLMPTQWRTISPIVGRTPAQCMQHYEKLLSSISEKPKDYDPREDPRRLGLGEIDPNPEFKPARPDPIDMDNNEKEMLAEARARLANTKGKKAKRKAREKQLEESRRLAVLQKAREIREAGLERKKEAKKSRRKMDYNREIPFHKPAPSGFFDVREEHIKSIKTSNDKFIGKRLDQIDGESRDSIEKKQKKKDEQKLKRLMKMNLPQLIAQNVEANRVDQRVNRTKLELPSPHVSDMELERLANSKVENTGGETGSVTDALISGYEDETLTPMSSTRTPRTARSDDIVLQEVRNALKRKNMVTPLHRGPSTEVTVDSQEYEAGTGFSSHVPNTQVRATPNPLATPSVFRDSIATPGIPNRSVTKTPLHDALGLNSVQRPEESYLKSERSQISGQYSTNQKQIKSTNSAGLGQKLAGLPEPQFSYEVLVPEVGDNDEPKERVTELDAEEKKRLQIAAAEAERHAELSRRSSVLKKKLPRPEKVNDSSILSPDNSTHVSIRKMINNELLKMIRHDNAMYPLNESEDDLQDENSVGKKRKRSNKSRKKKGKQSKKRKVPRSLRLPFISENDLSRAKGLIREEIGEKPLDKVSLNVMCRTQESLCDNFVYVTKSKSFIQSQDAPRTDKLSQLLKEFESVRKQALSARNRADKLGKRMNIKVKGYNMRCKNASDEVSNLWQTFYDADIRRNSFAFLRKEEVKALPSRMEYVNTLVQNERKVEEELQSRYQKLESEYMQLWSEYQ